MGKIASRLAFEIGVPGRPIGASSVRVVLAIVVMEQITYVGELAYLQPSGCSGVR